jgi:carbonic anhydrase
MKTLTKDTQSNITPDQAIELLRNGNQRFVQNLRYNRNLLEQVNETAEGQYPFATILSCIDSRTPAELVFDQGLGDIFSVRIAGNVVNDDIIGSMEFACKVAGSKLILVLGHTSCGAIKGACASVELEHLTGLLDKIQTAVKQAPAPQDGDNQNIEYVDNVASLNVQNSIKHITEKSQTLKEMVDDGSIIVIGAMYDVSNGQVTFLDHA